MKHPMRILQGLKLAAVLAVALTMGACASKNPLGADGAMASAATPGSQQDFVVNVGDRVFFESDQTELSPQAIATLEKQAQWLQSYAAIPSRSKATPTSAARANTTSRSAHGAPSRSAPILASRGIEASRMRTISYGKERPVAVCNDISCWSQNRRAVTVLNASS